MTCSDCGGEMTKAAIQHDDLSGWMVGWLCDCEPDDTIEVTIHAATDWTASVVFGAMNIMSNTWTIDLLSRPVPYPLEYLPEGAVRFISSMLARTVDELLYDMATDIDERIMNEPPEDGPLQFTFEPITITLTNEDIEQ